MAAAKKAPGLTDKQLKEFLELTRGADSVELKLTVPDENRRSTVEALGLDALDAYLRQVFFFDTPDLKLNRPAWSPGRDALRADPTTRW